MINPITTTTSSTTNSLNDGLKTTTYTTEYKSDNLGYGLMGATAMVLIFNPFTIGAIVIITVFSLTRR